MAATSEEAQEAVIHCDTEEEYYKELDNAGSKLVVVDCFAEWYVLQKKNNNNQAHFSE